MTQRNDFGFGSNFEGFAEMFDPKNIEEAISGFLGGFAPSERPEPRHGGNRRGGGRPFPADFFNIVSHYHDNDSVTYVFDMPGSKRDDISIETVEGLMTVKAPRYFKKSEKNEEGSFEVTSDKKEDAYSFELRLKDNADTSGITASYEEGVLSVTVPTREDAKPHKVTIS